MGLHDSHARRNRVVAAVLGLAAALAIVAAGSAFADRRDARTSVSIWRAGGSGYGGATAGAFISHRRDVEIGAGGEVRFPGVAATMDAATVEVHSVTDPAGTSVIEQRFSTNLATPEALLARQVGKPVTVVLAQGEVAGTLRAVSLDALVVETAGGGLEIIRRGEHVVDIKLGAARFDQEPTLEWKLATRRPGKHTLDVTYSARGLTWQPEYAAVLGERDTVDFTAWATVRNDAGIDLAHAELTLLSDGPAARGGRSFSLKVARPVELPAGATLQVELVPRRTGVKARRVAVFEAVSDQASSYPLSDCYSYPPPASGVRTEQMLELDGPGQVLPEGTVRVFRRAAGGGLSVVGEDALRVSLGSGALRVRVGLAPEITGTRTQKECRPDPSGHELRERVELRVENKGKDAVDVALREYMYRWHVWRIDREDEKGQRVSASAQEWRVRLKPGASKTLTYTVVYAW